MTKIYNHAQILTDFIDGVKVSTLAKEYGVHVTTIYRSLHKYGVQNLKVPGSLDSRNELIASVYEGGVNVKELSKMYGLSIPGIYAAIKSYKNSCV